MRDDLIIIGLDTEERFQAGRRLLLWMGDRFGNSCPDRWPDIRTALDRELEAEGFDAIRDLLPLAQFFREAGDSEVIAAMDRLGETFMGRPRSNNP